MSDRQHCAACSGWVSTYSGQGDGYACDGMDNPVAEITEKPSRETRSVTVETISANQLRSYGDHVYESYLTFSVPKGQLWASKYGETEAIVRQYIPLFVHSFSEVKPYQWPNAWLETLEQVSPGRWHVIIKSPYLD